MALLWLQHGNAAAEEIVQGLSAFVSRHGWCSGSALFFGDDMADAGLGEKGARLPDPLVLHPEAPGQYADRASQHAHIGVADDEADIRLLQERADIGQKHRVV